MSPLFKKLNLKDEEQIVILNAPDSFEAALAELSAGTTPPIEILRAIPKAGGVRFALAFAQTQAGLNLVSEKLGKASEGDVKLWIAYPKKSSKKYTCEFDRDSGWAVLGDAGFEPVRMVAIDTDWSAVRFRRPEYIKTMKRNALRPISKAGRNRVSGR